MTNLTSELEQFIKKAKGKVTLTSYEASDTHFSRVYVVLLSKDANGEVQRFTVAAFPNFESDESGKQASHKKAGQLIDQLKTRLEGNGLEVTHTLPAQLASKTLVTTENR